MSDEATQKPSRLGEWMLWILAGVFMTILAVAATSAAKLLLGWSEAEWIAASIITGALSLTWGSWAALLWTRSRTLKTLMLTAALIPGLLMVALGVWAFFALPENRWIWRWGWLIVAGHGLGAVAITLMIAGRRVINAGESLALRSKKMVAGWTLYPLVVVGASMAVFVAAVSLMPGVFCEVEGFTETLARWTVPSQAMILLSTVIPAGAHILCERLTRR